MNKHAGEMTKDEFNDQYDWYDVGSARQSYIAYKVQHTSEHDAAAVRSILRRCAAAAILGDRYIVYIESMTDDMRTLIHSSGFKTRLRWGADGVSYIVYGWAYLPEVVDIQPKEWRG
ncbi:MAG: hypothetical protein WC907_06035 [Acholeplasmataceae bacterium]